MANGRGWGVSRLAGSADYQSANPPLTSPPLLENHMAHELTQERLKELLHYDPETGVFTWVKSRKRTKAGDVAGYTCSGYTRIQVDYVTYRAHRLAYLYIHGHMPDVKIDHKDRDPSNNRISNLRPATNSQNSLNARVRSNNTSGYKGVHRHGPTGKWLASIGIDQKRHHLGLFDNILDAVSARKTAEETFGVSEFCL